MKNNNIAQLVFKLVSLAFLDVITFLFVLEIWDLSQKDIFPWVLVTVILTLGIMNAVIIAQNKMLKKFGIPMYASSVMMSIILYIFIMLFTGLFYKEISVNWYIILVLIVFLIYVSIIAGLMISGTRYIEQQKNQLHEKEEVINITLKLLILKDQILGLVNKPGYDKMLKAFRDLVERINSSTPFGRVSKQVVLTYENQILTKVNDLIELLDESAADINCEYIEIELSKLKDTIINREKLIVN